jgi:chromosome segregation ATPase
LSDPKALLKTKQNELTALRSEHQLVSTDVTVAESKIKDLKNQQTITNSQINELLTDKRKVDKENDELELKLQGRGKATEDSNQ